MYYYGNSYGYGNTGSCCGNMGCQNSGFGGNYAIILVLFILLIIILGARNFTN